MGFAPALDTLTEPSLSTRPNEGAISHHESSRSWNTWDHGPHRATSRTDEASKAERAPTPSALDPGQPFWEVHAAIVDAGSRPERVPLTKRFMLRSFSKLTPLPRLDVRTEIEHRSLYVLYWRRQRCSRFSSRKPLHWRPSRCSSE